MQPDSRSINRFLMSLRSHLVYEDEPNLRIEQKEGPTGKIGRRSESEL
jgi:hypothetical protein